MVFRRLCSIFVHSRCGLSLSVRTCRSIFWFASCA